MNVQAKFFKAKILVVVCAGLMLIAGVVSKRAIQAQSDNIEDQILRMNSQRAIDTLSTELFGLTSIASQWAAWDSTRRFLTDSNTEYISANLTASTFAQLRLNLIVFVDAKARIVSGRTFESSGSNPQSDSLPKSLNEHLSPDSPLVRDSNSGADIEGILVLPEAAMLIVSHPVRNESGRGPLLGMLILGRYLDKDELQCITKAVGLPVSIAPLVKESPMRNVIAHGAKFGRAETERAHSGPGALVGRRTLYDIYGSPTVSLGVTMNGDVYGLGLSTFNRYYYAIGWLLLTGLALLLANIWMINRSALSAVGSSVSSIRQALGKENGAAGGSGVDRDGAGKDEFSQLTAAINEMLGTLEVEQSRSDELRRELAQSHKMAVIGDLASTLAHDMSNPTNVIMMSGSTLSQLFDQLKKTLEERYREEGDFSVGMRKYSEIRDEIPALLQCVQSESQRMAHVIAELRNYAHSVGDAYYEEHVDINRVTASAVSALHDRLGRATKRFSAAYGADLPSLRGNSCDLEQALTNLIQNACDALTDTEQRIAVETRCSPDSKTVIITIADEGRGIPPDNMARVKEPFFTTRRAEGAAGLGLSVASAIIKKHGGRLNIESPDGRGTTVSIILPVAKGGSVGN
jgi:signal transduction histidine kinase